VYGKGSYRWGGKKQVGLCLVWCSGEVPPKVQEPIGVDIPFERKTSAGSWMDTTKGLANAARANTTISRDEYIRLGTEAYLELQDRWLASDLHKHESAGNDWDHDYAQREERGERYYNSWRLEMTRDEYIAKTLADYKERLKNKEQPAIEVMQGKLGHAWDVWKVNYDWWQENWPKTRACHRACTCAAYEFVGGSRENVARRIAEGNGVKGHYAPHKEEEGG
jgi:hypothetical protein